jgi:hypothetical protein
VEQLRLAAVQEEEGLAPRAVHLPVALARERKETVVRLMALLLAQVHHAQGDGDDRPAQ